MTIRHALLAILDQGDCYGSQLRAEYDRRTGAVWSLNVGQIYTTLDRLERDGLVRTGKRDAQGHLYYQITEAGRQDVAAWFTTPMERSAADRDDLATKVSLAVTLEGVDALTVVQVQHRSVEHRLAALRLQRGPVGSGSAVLAAELILEALIGAAEAELKWLAIAEQRISAAGPAGEAMPLDTRTPRRGRPRTIIATDV